MNIINGRKVDTYCARQFLDELRASVTSTLEKSTLQASVVIDAADKLSKSIRADDAYALLSPFGLSRQAAEAMVWEAKRFLSREYLETKLRRELGDFCVKRIDEHTYEKAVPLGVLTHIAAGNAAGLPAFSMIEGLLTGNINILKLPGNDDGLSTTLLDMLIQTEPRLAEYIYVFDLPSTDAEAIKQMLDVSDAVAVWGSDFAVSGIRSLSPPGMRIIEWGHKLSFACVTKKGETPGALAGIARDICETEQLVCSSPQCVYYEADCFEELKSFAVRLFKALEYANALIPARRPEPAAQAEITALLCLTSLEEILENKTLLRGDGFSVIADDNAALCASPMYRNVWVKPIRDMFGTLRGQKGYLQTASLACSDDEFQHYSELLTRCGACRITPCGAMTENYAGEPHDGRYALRRYVRTAVIRRSADDIIVE